jgi:hypothetical protein
MLQWDPGQFSRYSDRGMGWATDVPCFDFRHVQEIFFFPGASGPDLGPTLLPIQWVPEG